MIDVETLTRRGAFSRALDLYGELFARIQDRVTNDAEFDALRERYERGRTILETHRDSAADVPLSPPAAELLESYLGGPDPEDEEAEREWLTVLPEVLVNVRRAEELEDASQHASTAVARASTSALNAALAEYLSFTQYFTEGVWKSSNLVSDFLIETSVVSSTALGTYERDTRRMIVESFERYLTFARQPNGDNPDETSDSATNASKKSASVNPFAEAA